VDVRRIAAQYAETITPEQEVRVYRASYEPVSLTGQVVVNDGGLTVYDAQGVPRVRLGAWEGPAEPAPSVRFTYTATDVVEVHKRRLTPGLVWGLHWEVRTTHALGHLTHHCTDERSAYQTYVDAVLRWTSEPEYQYPELYKCWQQTDDAGVEGKHSVRLDTPKLGLGRPTRGRVRKVR
jgi:hypothetical protein